MNIEDTKSLARVLLKYRHEYYTSVLMLYMATFVIAQSFVLPITVPLCILSGTLFSPSYLALLYVCLAAAFGATGCYLNSKLFLKDIVSHYFPQRCAEWKQRVRAQHLPFLPVPNIQHTHTHTHIHTHIHTHARA